MERINCKMKELELRLRYDIVSERLIKLLETNDIQ
jgi:hypothetical protein